ncbi:NAD(P)-binding domain-containing protein [Streptomyces niveus]|uniref:NAD(P)-binding domain-containing protein n=1 Tax=Streptomyces niveus TaxID=193462 RepID=UPI003425EF7E
MSANPTPKPAVSVIGLGMMGTALAVAFLRAGHQVTVWNRSLSKTGPLAAQGAAPADTAADAVAASPLVVVCLSTYDTVRAVLEPLSGQLTGKTLANLTNGTPSRRATSPSGRPRRAPGIWTAGSWPCRR